MTQNEERYPFDSDQSKTWYNLRVNIPPELPNPYPDILPSGFEPMEVIQLRGRTYRNLATGRIPWWIIITSWLFEGIPSVLFIILVLSGILLAFAGLFIIDFLLFVLSQGFAIFVPAIVICILLKGTMAKMGKSRRHRQGKHI
ncbi:MAG: hypothetical protein F6K14_04185 [Symploca sp. SIO2C1]|nr:hypothetical protein [Symploca sp. SIO2C1]